MDYRDERDALRGRVENLEQALDEAKGELPAKHGDDEVARLAELERQFADARERLEEVGRALSEMKGSRRAPEEPDPDRDGLQPADAAAITREVAAESRVKARVADRRFGVCGMFLGAFALIVFGPLTRGYTTVSSGIQHDVASPVGVYRLIPLIPTVSAWALALGVMVRGYRRHKHEEWLRTNGIQLPARVVSVERRTDLRLVLASDYRLSFEVAGPRGPYGAACDVGVPLQYVAVLSGAEVNVRANPRNLKDILVEE